MVCDGLGYYEQGYAPIFINKETHLTRVVLDAATMKKLHDLTQPLQICDESGAFCAEPVPVLNPDDYEPGPPPELTPEELEKRRHSDKWYTTDDVLKHLESLGRSTSSGANSRSTI